MRERILFFLLCVSNCVGCVLVPGESAIDHGRRIKSVHHQYRAPRNPSLEGSHVFRVPKLNPNWWRKNSDEPLPWWWKPEASLSERKRTWFFRNPMHNFNNYVIGVSDRHLHVRGLNAHSIWNDEGPFNLTLTQSGPLIHLPMISRRGPWLEWYVGWRPTGSFGAALRKAQHDSDGTGPRGNSPKSRAIEYRAQQERIRREDIEFDPPNAKAELRRLPRT